MDEQRKLAEAEYFLDEMRKSQRFFPDEFQGQLSAFLSAARSVMQYIETKADKKHRLPWFQQLDINSKWCQFFRKKRNLNTHRKPFEPQVLPYPALPAGTHIIDLDLIETYRRRKQEGADESELTALMMTETFNDHVLCIDGCYANLLQSCDEYLEELRLNIVEAHRAGVI